MAHRASRGTGVRVALLLLAVPNLVTGVWAVFAPAHWYERFPGWAPRLVAAHPPFNEHLASDAGAGLLACGVAPLVAAVWLRRESVIVAMTTMLSFAAPHALFHVTHPADELSAAVDIGNAVVLVLAVVIPIIVLVIAVRSSDGLPGRGSPPEAPPAP